MDIKEVDSTEQRYLSVKQASIYLGLSTKTLYNWVEKGKMPCYKIGRVWRFDKDEIGSFIKTRSNQNFCYNVKVTCDGVERKGV